MAAQVGDRIPDVTLRVLGENGLEDLPLTPYFAGRKIVLFSVPGAFTPTCSTKHLPGFVARAHALAGKGADAVACLSVNDPYVMAAWQRDQGAEAIDMLPDGNGELTRALGLERDFTGSCMSIRGKRFAMIVDDGVITHLAIDDRGVDRSGADACLAAL